MGNEVFVSYRSIESEFALKIADVLHRANIPIWLDQLTGIKPGDDWAKVMQDGITYCAGLLACTSPAYITSKYCLREVQRADSLGKPIIPLLIEKVDKASWPLVMQSTQYINFTDWQNETAFKQQAEKLIERIRQLMPLDGEAVGELPDPQRNKAAEMRAIEDNIAQADTLLTDLNNFKRDLLMKRLAMYQKQYEAVSEAIMLSVSPMQLPQLEAQIEKIDSDINKVLSEIEQLSD